MFIDRLYPLKKALIGLLTIALLPTSFTVTSCKKDKKKRISIVDLDPYVDLSGVLDPDDQNVMGAVFDTSGNLFVSDRAGHRIWKVSTAKLITPFVGSGTQSSADGQGTSASISYPSRIVRDSSNNLYIAEYTHHPDYQTKIRKAAPDGTVTTIATFAANSGETSGLTFLSATVLLVSTYYKVWQVDITNGTVSDFSGTGAQGDVDGNAATSQYFTINDIGKDSVGNIWVADTGASKLKKLDSNGVSTSVIPNIRLRCLGVADGDVIVAKDSDREALILINQDLEVKEVEVDGWDTLDGTGGDFIAFKPGYFAFNDNQKIWVVPLDD